MIRVRARAFLPSLPVGRGRFRRRSPLSTRKKPSISPTAEIFLARTSNYGKTCNNNNGEGGRKEGRKDGWNGTRQKPSSARKIEDSEQNLQNLTGGKSIVVAAVAGGGGCWSRRRERSSRQEGDFFGASASASTLLDSTISPGKGETAALPRAGHSARFSISGRRSGVEQGRSYVVNFEIFTLDGIGVRYYVLHLSMYHVH